MMTTRREKIQPPTEQDFELAKKVAEWMGTLVDSPEIEKNDYLYNLSIYGKADVVNFKGVGIVASAVQAYLRDEARKQERADLTKSQHMGAVKDRIEVVAKVLLRKDIESFYGVKTLYKFVTSEGNVLTVFHTGRYFEHLEAYEGNADRVGSRVNIGETIRIVGTVKEHKAYQGVKETMLSRVEVVLSPEAREAAKTAAKTHDEFAADIEVDGVKYQVFNTVRADGRAYGFQVREVPTGKKRKGATVYKRNSLDESWTEAGKDWVINEVRKALCYLARKAFGSPKDVVRYAVVGHKNGAELDYYDHKGSNDVCIEQLSETEFTHRHVSYSRGEYKTLAEAEEDLLKQYSNSNLIFERREVAAK